MLVGEFNHISDAKGRVFVPAKWRDELGSQFIVARSAIENCLIGLPLGEWEKLSNKLAALPLTDRKAQSVARSFTRWAADCEVDKQGRILIPQNLRDFAGIKTETTFVGKATHIEIWDKQQLEAYDVEEDDHNVLMDRAAEYGI